MRLARTPHFLRSYNKAPKEIQRAFDKEAVLLLANFGHPSLLAKKVDESQDVWQAHVSRDWCFYFTIEGAPTSCTRSGSIRNNVHTSMSATANKREVSQSCCCASGLITRPGARRHRAV